MSPQVAPGFIPAKAVVMPISASPLLSVTAFKEALAEARAAEDHLRTVMEGGWV